MNRVALGFFLLHIPVFIAIAFFNETGTGLASVLTLLVIAGPVIAMNTLRSQRAIAIVMGITSMFMGGLLVHFGQGPVQIEMHFYFFVLLALLAVFADPLVIIAAALTVTLHHTLLWQLLPSSVFNYDAPFWVIGVHALFVVLESIAACYIARTFYDNLIGLEKKVEQRTAALAERNRDMRTILDAVQQGFFTIDRDLRISEERSGAVDRLFGDPRGMTLPAFLAQFDPPVAEWAELGLFDVFAEIMPVEVTIDQLPTRFAAEGKTYHMDYTPVYDESRQLTHLAVVFSDISAAVEKEQLESVQREMLAMVHQLTEDKTGFQEFFEEAESIIEYLKEQPKGDALVAKRKVHTLKGISSIYGIDRVAKVCHEFEDIMASNPSVAEPVDWDPLFVVWDSVVESYRKIVDDSSTGIELTHDEYYQLLMDILNSKSRDELALRIASWRLEPTERRLHRIGERAKALAQRLGKGDIEVSVNSRHIQSDPEHWAEFWAAFTHVVRNAIDHGMEPPAKRRVEGKPENGRLFLETSIVDDQYVIRIRDDGRGIDWDQIRELANGKGLAVDTYEDLVNALLTDGLSTHQSVSEISGRGVGLASIRQVTEKLQGRIEIESQQGIGTEFQFKFPVHQLSPSIIDLFQEHQIEVASPHSVFQRRCEAPTGNLIESTTMTPTI